MQFAFCSVIPSRVICEEVYSKMKFEKLRFIHWHRLEEGLGLNVRDFGKLQMECIAFVVWYSIEWNTAELMR